MAAGIVGSALQGAGPVNNGRDDYNSYAVAAAEAGNKVVSMAQWIAAGRPKS